MEAPLLILLCLSYSRNIPPNMCYSDLKISRKYDLKSYFGSFYMYKLLGELLVKIRVWSMFVELLSLPWICSDCSLRESMQKFHDQYCPDWCTRNHCCCPPHPLTLVLARLLSSFQSR